MALSKSDEISIDESDRVVGPSGTRLFFSEHELPSMHLNLKTSSKCGSEPILDEKPSESPHATATPKPDGEQIRRSNCTPREQKFEWKSPAIMVFALLLGLSLAVGHHGYYGWLNGQDVGSTERQQWSLRFGNAFAISIALCFKTSVGVAYIQYVWRTLSRESLRLKTVNDSFELSTNLWAFMNWEVALRMRLASLVAFIIWLLPLASLFAPATLSVGQSTRTSISEMQVQRMNISSTDFGNNFTYPWTSPNHDGKRFPEGPTPRVARIVAAVAYTGQVLPFQIPNALVNGSYTLSAEVPLVQCTKATDDDISMILDKLNGGEVAYTKSSFEYNATNKESHRIGYLALRESYFASKANNASVIEESMLIAQGPGRTGRGPVLVVLSKPTVDVIKCQLCNSTIGFTVESRSGIPKITVTDKELFPIDDENKTWENNDYVYTSFNMFFLEILKYVLGVVESNYDGFNWNVAASGLVRETNLATGRQWYDSIRDTTRLTGLDGGYITAEQMVRNTTFAHDFETLALNASLSLLSDPTLCEMVPANVTLMTTSTVYVYKSSNLLIAYGVAAFLSIASAFAGAYAFYTNGISYDTKITTLVSTMQSIEMKEPLLDMQTKNQTARKRAESMSVRLDAIDGFIVRSP